MKEWYICDECSHDIRFDSVCFVPRDSGNPMLCEQCGGSVLMWSDDVDGYVYDFDWKPSFLDDELSDLVVYDCVSTDSLKGTL